MLRGIAAIGIVLVIGAALPPAATQERGAGPVLTGDGGVPAFYVWDGALPQEPGRLLRSEPMVEAAPLQNAAQSHRILYTSTDGLHGKARVTVSGALYLPKGLPPRGGWPLLAWAHGTVGVADVCAPSFTGRSQRDLTYLDFWLSQGYAIVASDYQGLGTPGPHPYLATRPVAHSVLDSIRAVKGPTFGIGEAVVLIGQSQGAGAVVATAGYAAAYAPALDIRGVVATGTPYFSAESQAAIADARPPDLVDPLLAYDFFFLSLREQLEPDFRIEAHVTEQALPIVRAAATTCMRPLAQRIVAEKLTRRSALRTDSAEGLRKHAGLMGFPTLALGAPLFMGIGGKDRDAPPAMQQALAADACRAGSRVEVHLYPEADHAGTVNGSTNESSAFVRRAFAGERIAGNCGMR